MKYTAAHWGAYQFDGVGGLSPISDDESPGSIGKGWVSAASDAKSRVLHPAIRKGWLEGDKGKNRSDDSFVEVSWEKAIQLAADEVARVAQDYGNGAIFGGSYGWSSAGRLHHAQTQMRRFLTLAGGYVSSRDTYSHAAAEVLLPHVFGMGMREYQDDLTSFSQIEKHCETLLCFGGISARTAQVTSAGTSRHDMESWIERIASSGTQIISVSPQQSDFKLADSEHISIRPGTDLALILALSCEIAMSGQANEDFLTRCTSGWPEYRAYLVGEIDGTAKSAQWAAKLCGINASVIQQLANRLVSTRSMISITWALQRADHGEQPLWAAIALACIVGQIGKPGGGFAFGYGCMAALGRPKKLVNWPSVRKPKNPISDFIPVARVADMLLQPGGRYVYNGEQRTYPDIKLIYWTGGNPFHHHQDLNRLNAAWCKPETIIVNEHSWTATARRADIVLPATTPLERSDIMMNRRDPTLLFMSPVFEPLGKSKDDFEIFRLLSKRLGFEEAFTEERTPDDWLLFLWQQSQQVAAQSGFSLPDFETFKMTGRFDVPQSNKDNDFLDEYVADPHAFPLRTESGRITLFNETIAAMALEDCPGHPTWLEPEESLLNAETDELHLISGQPETRLHSQNDRGTESVGSKIQKREPATIHSNCAAKRGLAAGDIVRIYNKRGACLAGIQINDGIREDCISLATGAWFDPQIIGGRRLEVHGNPNVLTIDKGASQLSQGNIAHTALVRIEKWEAPLPALTTDRPPEISK